MKPSEPPRQTGSKRTGGSYGAISDGILHRVEASPKRVKNITVALTTIAAVGALAALGRAAQRSPDAHMSVWPVTLRTYVSAAPPVMDDSLNTSAVDDAFNASAMDDAFNASAFDDPFNASALDDAINASAVADSCSLYDDDIVYNESTCFDYDNASCASYCHGWCDTLCGDACDIGGGALCALKQLRNLSETCHSGGFCQGAAANKTRHASSVVAVLNSLANDDIAFGMGCDTHALCEYCFPYKSCDHLYAKQYLSSANGALVLLAQLNETCRDYFCQDVS